MTGLVWLVSIVVATEIGRRKDQLFAGIGLGLLLGPLGVVIIALLPKKLRECPVCGEKVAWRARICRYCLFHVGIWSELARSGRWRRKAEAMVIAHSAGLTEAAEPEPGRPLTPPRAPRQGQGSVLVFSGPTPRSKKDRGKG